MSQALEESIFNRKFKLFRDVLRIFPKTENLDKGGHCNSVGHFRTVFYPGLLSTQVLFLSSDTLTYQFSLIWPSNTFVSKFIIILLLPIFFSANFLNFYKDFTFSKFIYSSSAVSSVCPYWISCCYRQATIKFQTNYHYLT